MFKWASGIKIYFNINYNTLINLVIHLFSWLLYLSGSKIINTSSKKKQTSIQTEVKTELCLMLLTFSNISQAKLLMLFGWQYLWIFEIVSYCDYDGIIWNLTYICTYIYIHDIIFNTISKFCDEILLNFRNIKSFYIEKCFCNN